MTRPLDVATAARFANLDRMPDRALARSRHSRPSDTAPHGMGNIADP